MRRTHRSFDRIRFAALLFTVVEPGCGGQTPVDPDQARATLTQALDAWRDGRTIDDMTNVSPPIAVADPYWKEGFKLSRYEVGDKSRSAGFDLKMPVKLWLEDTKGKSREETVKYTVSVQPSRTVIRAPL